MPSGKIYLISSEKKLTAMDEFTYDSEDILQELLAAYPALLAGEQIQPDAPLKWLLIKREIGIPAENNEGDRWSLDHLFVDQKGIPTFVECKRSSDTRIRREVVGQMLDYAANGPSYWPMDKIRQSAAETAMQDGKNLDDLISGMLDLPEEADKEALIEGFWGTVEKNLNEGNLRLLFVSDQIPRELRAVIEFLNSQMAKTEVLGLEIKQYAGSGAKALVPRVLGTLKKQSGGTSQPPRIWTESAFLEDLKGKVEDLKRKKIERILEEAKGLEKKGLISIAGGRGKDTGSLTFKKDKLSLCTLFSNGSVGLNMGGWKLPLTTSKKLVEELGSRLDFHIKYEEHVYPNIADRVVSTEEQVTKFIEWMTYAVHTVQPNKETGKEK